ncbi:MAG: amidohydrolase [Microbacterium sp.]|jgi:imidazolonepropionase-like amidohydrolase|nr:amidohydrolase [Microbacterium sp.]
MNTTTLRGVSLWDGEIDRGLCDLSWSGGSIVAVTPSPAGTIDSGLSVIPGLVDTHVHLDTNAITGQADRSWALITPPEERSLHILAHARRALEGGVTTLRDLASETAHFAVSRVLDAGIVDGPRLYGAGPVGMTAGHGDLFTPPHVTHRPPVADSPDECRKLVRHWARAGAAAIKVYTSGGILSMGDKIEWRNHTDAELAATVDEAHALGMLVAAHSHTSEGIDRALRAGADSIEHGSQMTPQQLVDLSRDRIPVAPTLLIHEKLTAKAVGVTDEAHDKSHGALGDRDELFRAAGAAGIRYVLGTDANGVFTLFGDQMEEVRLMASKFGWTPARALEAATSDAADAIGLGELVGRVRGGLAADFVVLEGRPWEDISELHTDRIRAVVARGKVQAGAL